MSTGVGEAVQAVSQCTDIGLLNRNIASILLKTENCSWKLLLQKMKQPHRQHIITAVLHIVMKYSLHIYGNIALL